MSRLVTSVPYPFRSQMAKVQLRASVNRSWSPNGKKIAFSLFVRRNKTGGQIFTMNADGSNQKNLTKQTHSSSPAWSPDGKKIVFLRDDIYVMKSDGTKVKRLTNNLNPGELVLAAPDWQPLP
ncbi:MAG TPA: DPP IV N-terminal domain-containing protein [Rubrobacter sp.]|nr:DPP IV N-terminal domain-containing protein [Rubrobacter sp.]